MVALDRDRHLTQAAAARLADLGFRPEAVCGAGDEGCPARAPFDRIFVSYAVASVPPALVEQLAPGGRLLVHVTSVSPSWPALAVVERTLDGHVQAELRAVEFAHRAGHGLEQIWPTEGFRQRITAEPATWTQRSMLPPPADTDRGLWLAADHLLGGPVRDFGAENLVIGAPGCGSWLRAEPLQSENVCCTGAANISARARANRTTLSNEFSEPRTINHLTEWWHWPYGDRHRALQTKQPATLYGPAEIP